MRLFWRIVLIVVPLLVLTTAALSAALVLVVQQQVIASSRSGAEAVAQLLAQASAFASDVSVQTENTLGDQMVIQARLAAQLVSVAEENAKMSPDQIDAILKAVSDETVASDKTAALEFWITDENGHAYLTNTGQDFTFSSNPLQQPQMYVFWELLGEKNGQVIQEARQREAGPGVYKYVGVSGVDKSRIVQVGYSAPYLENLRSNATIQKMVDTLTDSGVAAGTTTSTIRSGIRFIRILNEYSSTIAKSSHPQQEYPAGGAEWILIGDARRENKSFSAFYQSEGVLRAVAPVVDAQGLNKGAVYVYQSADRITVATNAAIVRGVALTAAALVLGILASVVLALWVVRPVQQLGQAADALARGDWEQKIRPSGILEINALGRAFTSMTTQLREMYAGLEDKVKERTREVERRAAQVATGAEISHTASQELNPDQLLQRVVELIRERFGLYYAAVFLVDKASQNAVLRAGTGEPGRIMLERKHKLEVGGNSMVGWACANKQARIALDVGDEPVRFANPLLPKTRSEMALPLRIADRIVGALDIQSEQAQAFDSNDITALQGMADQIAVALENARLFQQAQASLKELEQANRLLTQQGWQAFFLARPAEFAEFHQVDAAAFTPADMESKALSVEGQALDAPALQASTFRVPLTVHSQVIGELVVEPLGAGQRAADQPGPLVDLELLETVAAQVAQTIDGARLFEESQRRAAREQTIGQITAHMRETLDIETMLKTATQEICQSLGLPEIVIRLTPSDWATRANDNGDGAR